MPELIFIIVEPAREENVGASARAMKTMGLKQLRLVRPKCNPLGTRALATAHASADILENALVLDSFQQAIEGIDLVIASTAKKRTVYEDHHKVEDLPGIILAKGDSISTVAIVFGREESGLTNDELSFCHLFSNIPMAADYPSLNLGQAVMVYAAYLSKLTLEKKETAVMSPPVAELSVVREKAHQVLDDVGLQPSDTVYPRIMERLMLLNKDEVNLFHTFCKAYLLKYHGRIK
ncbi:MAG: tRNA/rRNA methyltransferase [Bacteroidales bacterium]